MPTSAETTSRGGTVTLVDTSAALAFVLQDHPHHAATYDALADRRLGLSGHAAFETYSVLTRMPPPSRLSPEAARDALRATFPETRYLSASASAALLDRLAGEGVAGGAVYDALVAAAATEHDKTLVTRDRRALETYRAAGAQVELIDDGVVEPRTTGMT